MNEFELTNMIMVHDRVNNRVVVQNRVKYWCGISFPGGHVEPNESFYDSAVREVWEETGLVVENLKFCGIVHWFNNKNGDRYLVYCYYTSDYKGKILDSTEEGAVYWQDLDSIDKMPLAPNFGDYIKLFLDDGLCEIFCSWNEDEKTHELTVKPSDIK